MVKDIQKYEWLIPEKVLPRLHVVENGQPPFSGFNINYLYQLISTICIHLREENNNQYLACLHSQILRKLIPNAEIYLKYLMGIGVVERQSSYKVGEHSYKYRICNKYVSEYRIIAVIDPKLINRIRDHRTHIKKRNSRKYPNQNKHLRSMTIEYKEAKEFINNHPYESINKHNYALSCIERIHRKAIYIKVNDTNNRLDSNLTNLPRVLRKFVRIYNKPLWGVDISNSQPYLLSTVVLNPGKTKQFFPDRFPLNDLESLSLHNKSDVIKYAKLVSSGKFYEYLLKEFATRGYRFKLLNILNKELRDQMKNKTLTILFDKNCHRSKERLIFQEIFPNIAHACEIIRANQHAKLAIMLQRIESHLVLDVIMSRINREYPHIIAVTVHDSIYVTSQEHQQIVKQIMEQELKKFTGYKPNLKIENKE